MNNDEKILPIFVKQTKIIDIKKLEENLDIVGTIRFLQQFDNGGQGDYTKEKYEKEENILTIEEMIEQMGK